LHHTTQVGGVSGLVRDAVAAVAAKSGNPAKLGPEAGAVVEFLARLAMALVTARDLNGQRWAEALVPYLEVLLSSYEEAEEAAAAVCEACKKLGQR
jgi:hypothetical protein